MTKEEFKTLVGEDPEDILGPDWENYIEDFMKGFNREEKESP